MKNLGKMKMFIAAALLAAGMTSCLKTEDPKFGFWSLGAYVMQQNTTVGEKVEAKFAPYIIFSVNEPLSTMTSVVSTSNPLGIPGKIKDGYTWESNVHYTSTLPEETYTIKAVNAEGEVAEYTLQLGVDAKEALGVFDPAFTYSSSEGLKVKWEKVANADYFELVAWDAADEKNKVIVAHEKGEKTELVFNNYDASTNGFENGKKYVFRMDVYKLDERRYKKIQLETLETFTVPTWGTSVE